MKIKEISNILSGHIICCEDKTDREVYSACGSDMMSDVLAFVKDQGVLLTGLSNPQVVRTAEMMDIKCIVLVRGKKVDAATVELAKKHGIVIVSTQKTLFEACGLLYSAGLKS